MNKYNIDVTDPNFQNLFNEFCNEHKNECIDFLKGNMDFISTTTDRTPYFDTLLSTKRIFLRSKIRTEFDSLPNNEQMNFDDFLSNKIDSVFETNSISSVLKSIDKKAPLPLNSELVDKVLNTSPLNFVKNKGTLSSNPLQDDLKNLHLDDSQYNIDLNPEMIALITEGSVKIPAQPFPEDIIFKLPEEDQRFPKIFTDFCSKFKTQCVAFLQGNDAPLMSLPSTTKEIEKKLSSLRTTLNSNLRKVFNETENSKPLEPLEKSEKHIQEDFFKMFKNQTIDKLDKQGMSIEDIANYGSGFSLETVKSSVNKFLNNNGQPKPENKNDDNKPKP